MLLFRDQVERPNLMSAATRRQRAHWNGPDRTAFEPAPSQERHEAVAVTAQDGPLTGEFGTIALGRLTATRARIANKREGPCRSIYRDSATRRRRGPS